MNRWEEIVREMYPPCEHEWYFNEFKNWYVCRLCGEYITMQEIQARQDKIIRKHGRRGTYR